ncbi:Beta-lactamase domain-containing protein, partial [Thalictrum thalictroides]
SNDLLETVENEAATNAQFFYDSPIQSDLEAKLKQLLIKLASANKIIGIQVCVYKDGKVVIDSVAGVLGENDPRPVQHDSLFSVFSTTKGITAGMVHWLVDNGKLKLEENIANIWPGFGVNKKDSIKVHHVLNHTSGLHNAASGSSIYELNWKASLNGVVTAIPESEPGQLQLYHYSAFGFLCGGIIEHVSGKKFQEVLDEAIVRPLNIEGELYIGIPPGLESRVATLSADMEDIEKMLSASTYGERPPSSAQKWHIVNPSPHQIYSVFCTMRHGIEAKINIGSVSDRAREGVSVSHSQEGGDRFYNVKWLVVLTYLTCDGMGKHLQKACESIHTSISNLL